MKNIADPITNSTTIATPGRYSNMSRILTPRVLAQKVQKSGPASPGKAKTPDFLGATPKFRSTLRAIMDRPASGKSLPINATPHRPGATLPGDLPPRVDLGQRRPSRPARPEESTVAPEPDRCLAVPIQTPWSRPEAPPTPPLSPRRPPETPPTPPRVFMGRGPDGAEARLAISSGPLAGTEIHLRESSRLVSATILTRATASGQSVSRALDEVARRLSTKGVAFRAQYGPRR